jgi:hypothetical protein
MKRTSILRCDADALRALGPAAVALGRAEGLEGHARSVAIRLNTEGGRAGDVRDEETGAALGEAETIGASRAVILDESLHRRGNRTRSTSAPSRSTTS